jgi:uncharacterized protein YjiS (DUF1127 family)
LYRYNLPGISRRRGIDLLECLARGWDRFGSPHTLARMVDTFALWHERDRQRRVLLTLDDRLLSDIGVTRAEAEGEAARPFWRG